MIFSTTNTLQGQEITEYLGIVTGEAIIGANAFKDFFAGIRDIIGGRSASYERVLKKAKNTAIEEMEDRAKRLGADAIVGIDLDYESLGANGGMLMVVATGTAVKLR